MALAPTNPDMMEVARKAHILSTQEDMNNLITITAAALDAKLTFVISCYDTLFFRRVKNFYRRYVNIVNPR